MLITLKTIETFYYPYGYKILVHSSLGKSEFEMRPSDSTLLLMEFCKDEFSHLCKKILKVSPGKISFEDMQIFIGDDLSSPILIHENVLLVHVIDETFSVQVTSNSLDKLVKMRSLQNSLCNSIRLGELEQSIQFKSDDEDPKTSTIHLSLHPPFPYDLDSAHKWSTDVLLRYVVEVIELPQYKGDMQMRMLHGADFLFQSTKFKSFSSSIQHPLHRMKILEHSDQLLLGVLKKQRAQPANISFKSLSSLEVASLLLESYGVKKIPIFIARNDFNGESLSSRTEEDLMSLFSSIDEEEASLVIQYFSNRLEIEENDVSKDALKAGDEALEALNDQMFVSCADSEGFDEGLSSPFDFGDLTGEILVASPVLEPMNTSPLQQSTRLSQSLPFTNEISEIGRIFSHPTLLEDDDASSVNLQSSVIIMDGDNREAEELPVDGNADFGDGRFSSHDEMHSSSETAASSERNHKEPPIPNEGSYLNDAVSFCSQPVIHLLDIAGHTSPPVLTELPLLAEQCPANEAANGNHTSAEGKPTLDLTKMESEYAEPNALSCTNVTVPTPLELADHDTGIRAAPFAADGDPFVIDAGSTCPNLFGEWEGFLVRVRSCFARYPPSVTSTAEAALVRFILLGHRVLRLVDTLSSANETLLLATASSIVRSANKGLDVYTKQSMDELAISIAMVTCFVCCQVVSDASRDTYCEVGA